MIPTRQFFQLIVLVIVVAGLATAAGAATPVTFTDPVGDAQGGPDVTAVTINGDAATGTMTFTVTAPGYLPTSPDGLRRFVTIWLDTDTNASTGDPIDGTEYELQAHNDSSGRWWAVGRWNGSGWEFPSQSSAQSFSRTGDVLSWTVNKSDLGGTGSFRFYVQAETDAADKRIAQDLAPDRWGDRWYYDLAPAPPSTAKPVQLKVAAPQTTPRVPTAGKRFTVSFPVYFEITTTLVKMDPVTGVIERSEATILSPVTSGKMVCDPSVAGKVIPHAESLKNGQARLSFAVPGTAKGKLLKIKVKITATVTEVLGGKTLTTTKIATFRVK